MAAKKTASAKRAPAKKGAAAKKTAAKTTQPKGRHIRVRMYNVGFGDAFLVTIPDGSKERRILFDCGSIEASDAGGPMKNIVEAILKDAGEAPGKNASIDLVVATHRHKDHVSGFSNARWNSVDVKEVWMPWTEHPTDPAARRIRDKQAKIALGLQAALAAAPAVGNAARQLELDVSRGIADNALMLSNDAAMKTLHSGFAGAPLRRFLPTKRNPRLIEPEILPGVRVHVLGPSRDPDVIRDMEPAKGESFLRLRAAGAAAATAGMAPFAIEYILKSPMPDGSLPPADRAAIDAAGDLSELSVAASLDKAVNGTSLMLLLEVGGTLLLFPGDAQWGTWTAVLADPEWRELLQGVAFYKIGHHGSHNATPPGFVRELMPSGCCAMASTLKRKIWPDIPRRPLLTALVEKGASLARSDKPPKASGGAFRVAPGVVEAWVPF